MQKEQIKNLLSSNAGKFMTVTFIKKDGTERTINGRSGVTKYLKGGQRTSSADDYFLIYENKNGYRNVAFERVTKIKMQGAVITF